MSHEELIDKLYTEMAEFSFLTPYLSQMMWRKLTSIRGKM